MQKPSFFKLKKHAKFFPSSPLFLSALKKSKKTALQFGKIVEIPERTQRHRVFIPPFLVSFYWRDERETLSLTYGSGCPRKKKERTPELFFFLRILRLLFGNAVRPRRDKKSTPEWTRQTLIFKKEQARNVFFIKE